MALLVFILGIFLGPPVMALIIAFEDGDWLEVKRAGAIVFWLGVVMAFTIWRLTSAS